MVVVWYLLQNCFRHWNFEVDVLEQQRQITFVLLQSIKKFTL